MPENYQTVSSPTVTLVVIALCKAAWSTVRLPQLGTFGLFLTFKGQSQAYSVGQLA